MSGETSLSAIRRRRPTTGATSFGGGPARVLALASAVLLLSSVLVAPYRVTDVVGGTRWLVVFVVAALVLAHGLASIVPEGLGLPVGLALGTGLFVAGLGGYLLLIPDVYYALFSLEQVTLDTVALLTGQSVLMLLDADLWVIGIAPAPVFLTWYLAFRRHYEVAALAGGATVAFFTLTGDATAAGTTVGMVGVLGTLGFGSLDRWDGTWDQVQDVGLLLVLAIIAANLLDVVPRGGTVRGGSGQGTTLEGTLVGTPGQVPIVGSISLSPAVRFTVEADAATYWRVASYDRYTGRGWLSTGDVEPYRGSQSGPRGESEVITQEFEVRAPTNAMPAAWKPVQVEEPWADNTLVDDTGGLQPANTLDEGDRYRVVSESPVWTPGSLRESGMSYPQSITDRYLQLPESTPSRLVEHAAEIVTDVDSPYDAAMELRDWLRAEKAYSLQVPAVRTNAADSFVFELDRGYCVHFATALTVMLRAIDVPARFVVGYSTGERIGPNRYRVRGLNSHAWTEVFFPDTGWVAIDPTPPGPRDLVRQRRLGLAGDGGGSGSGDGGQVPEEDEEMDTTASTVTPPTQQAESPTRVPGFTPDREQSGEMNLSDQNRNGTITPPPEMLTRARLDEERNSSPVRDVPETPRGTDGGDRLTILAGAVGLVLGAYRVGAFDRMYRSIWVRRQTPTGSPEADVERALERLEYVLSRDHRGRQPDETARSYLEALEAETDGALDERISRVIALYERVRYSDDPWPEDAAEAVRLVDELVDER